MRTNPSPMSNFFHVHTVLQIIFPNNWLGLVSPPSLRIPGSATAFPPIPGKLRQFEPVNKLVIVVALGSTNDSQFIFIMKCSSFVTNKYLVTFQTVRHSNFIVKKQQIATKDFTRNETIEPDVPKVHTSRDHPFLSSTQIVCQGFQRCAVQSKVPFKFHLRSKPDQKKSFYFNNKKQFG